ncbi:YeeE/YedE thiosulfate transporter family protein [Candidatus Poribacteria bacterium]
MLKALHEKKGLQLILGLIIGILFGFLLQKGGATKYHIILGQLLLTDFTVVKIMLSAIITGMLGIHLLRSLGLVQLHPKPGSFGASVIGGLIFGVGFAVLGYCPGTIAGAVGQGSIDSLVGGVGGILFGSWIFIVAYPKLQRTTLNKGAFGELTLPKLLKVNPWVVVLPVVIVIAALLMLIEKAGL